MRSNTRGFTLIELLISLVLLAIVAGVAVTYLIQHTRAFADGLSRSETVQNLRYLSQRLSTDLSTVGTHVSPGQPVVVHAGESMIAFHADFATNLEDDPFAVFYTPGAPTGQVSTPSAPLTLPGTAISYPTEVYETADGIQSPAELIILYFDEDVLSDRSGDFALFRQVNDGAPEIIARNLRRIEGEPFFRYFRVREEVGTGLVLDSVAGADLPVVHPDAGGLDEVADSIRGVRVQLMSSAPLEAGFQDAVELRRVIDFPNAERVGSDLPLCGTDPILGIPLNANLDGDPGDHNVLLTWDPAVDEAGGEQDVLRYLIWRRIAGAPSWGDPYRSIPSGAYSYSWRDVNVQEGVTYQYSLAAQDCTPNLSERVVSAPVTIPVTP